MTAPRPAMLAEAPRPTFCRCGDALENGACPNEHCRFFVRPLSCAELAEAPRVPTQDEQDGIKWWNGLNPPDRRLWLSRCGGKTVAEARTCYLTWGVPLHFGSMHMQMLIKPVAVRAPDWYRVRR